MIPSLIIALSASIAHAQKAKDILWRSQGSMLSGKIESVSADFVSIQEKRSTQKVAVDQITKLRFGDDPVGFDRVRSNVANGQIEQAKSQIQKVKPAGRSFVQQDVAFYRALIASKLALQGQSNPSAAVKLMNKFLTENSDSLRYYEACEVMGDLATSMGKFGHAAKYYSRLTKSKSIATVARGNLLQGDALLMQGNAKMATQMFQQVAGCKEPRLSRLGEIGIAKCQATDRQSAVAAIQQLEKLIQGNDSKDTELFARAYNALGRAYDTLGDSNASLDAYLHTDLLFYSESNQHAEALYHLTKLWSTANKPAEAARARTKLKQGYAASLWAKK